MNSVDRVFDLQCKMTQNGFVVDDRAMEVFTDLYRCYGLPGIEAMHEAGCTTPDEVLSFYDEECNGYASEVARVLNLD